MLKRGVLGLVGLFVFLLFLLAQPVWADEEISSQEGFKCSFLTGAGMTKIDGESYLEMEVKPEINFGKLGVGLAVLLRYNTDQGVRKEDLDEVEDFIHYIRWANKGSKPFYARLGELDKAILGNGFILNWYSNRGTDTSAHLLGAEFDLKFKNGGLETVINDVTDPRLYGGRLYFKPLKLFGLEVPLLDQITLGLTQVTDTDYNPDTSAKEELNVSGFDLQWPVIEDRIVLSYEYGRAKDYGDGSALGIGGGVKISLINFNYKLAARNIDTNFCPSMFNSLYEISRPGTRSLSNTRKIKGWYGEAGLGIGKILNFVFAYQDEEDKDPTLHGELLIPALLKMSFSLEYDQTNAKDPFDFGAPNSVVAGKLTYDIMKHITLTCLYEQVRDDKAKKTKETSMLVKMHF